MASHTHHPQTFVMLCRHLLGLLCTTLQRAVEAVHRLRDRITGHARPDSRPPSTIKGLVVLVERSALDFNPSSYVDRVGELLGRNVSFQLVSATVGDQNLGGKGKMGKEAYMTKGREETAAVQVKEGESVFEVTFEWDVAVLGTPGAVIVRNNHHSEFHLRSLTLHDVPGTAATTTTTTTAATTTTTIHFACNSWVYPTDKYSYDRVFFANHPYLPSETPEPLRRYREEELLHLRGEDVTRQLEEWDRVYGYAYYNDLGSPDDGPDHSRPVLGGSEHYPYPRRGRTNRPPTTSDPNTESRLPLLSLNIYVPRDERFGHLKMSDFLAYALKALAQSFVPLLHTFFDKSPGEFDSFQDILKLYEEGLRMPESAVPEGNKADLIPFELIRELVRMDGTPLLKLPMPQVIQANKSAWRTDEEFGREMLAGVNPVMISCLKEFPPVSKLDPSKYGQQNSTITQAHILRRLEGLTVEEAINNNRLFVLDYHDILMPYLARINSTPNKVYASRTMLFLNEDGTLKPLAIELSLPHPDGETQGAIGKVFTPAKYGTRGSLWELAKAYVTVNDSGYHQLISHWLNTHASMEPFVIATHRQLSVIHPINKLLIPHYRDTMNINALARQILINAGGLFEKTVFPDMYALEMSSMVYRNWKFTEQGLPTDLLKRGIAIQDADNPSSIRLLIKDYPYANDGLSIWYAIEKWVQEYCTIYYTTDGMVVNDKELQAWWKEIREVGHGDKKDETWWPKMHTIHDLTQTCTTIIWVASALHAAVNFGQYPYAGYIPNRPTISRRFMPQPRTLEFVELRRNPDKVFLQTITSQLQAILGISLIEILSKHSSDEVYLGQRDTEEWTTDRKALEAFERFREELIEIEKRIMDMNQDEKLKNRNGPVKMPYTLLFPSTSDHSGAGGLTGKGIPNSISI